MSSELVIYIVSAAIKPLAAVMLLYDCKARVCDKCVLITAQFDDGKLVQGVGCTIFGALHDLMAESKKRWSC